jgi:hypothetical protein
MRLAKEASKPQRTGRQRKDTGKKGAAEHEQRKSFG